MSITVAKNYASYLDWCADTNEGRNFLDTPDVCNTP